MIHELCPDLSDKFSELKSACYTDVSAFKAGGVRKNYAFWRANCHDPSILDLIFGLKIPVKQTVYQTKVPKEIQFSDAEDAIVEREIQSMLTQGIIVAVDNCPENGEFISNIFIRPKKDGGVRVILNLRNFNEFVEKSHFKMNSLQSAIDLMSPNAYLASVDFKSAYYSVSIQTSHRKYLRFFYKGQKYQFCCLPNGLTTGPRDFTQVAKTLFRILREMGHTNTWYLDDSLLVHKTFRGCLQNVLDTIEISRRAGFTIHPDKSVFVPTRTLVFLGFVLCTSTMTVRLTPEKCLKIKNSIAVLLQKSIAVIQEVAELIGQLVATFPAVPLGKLYYRQIDIDKAKALKQAKGDYSRKMCLSQRSKNDLKWWFRCIESSYTKIESKNPDITLKTDASNYGFGGCSETNSWQGQWNAFEQCLHINQKELLAVLYCLQALCDKAEDVTIKVMTDNTTTMCYINNMGGKIEPCNEIARKIWLWAIDRNIWLVSCFIPGKLNIEADQLSRLLNETTEWSLEPSQFDRVLTMFPGLNIDLFASHLNNKLPQYVSWLPDKNAAFCDAFLLDWSQFYAYAFPPFNLIGKVLRKVVLDRAEIVVIVPEWRTQFWFSKLMSMLTHDPLFLPRNGRAIFNPLNQRATRITSHFIACRISGSAVTTNDCLVP